MTFQFVDTSLRWLPILDPNAFPIRRPEVICDRNKLFWSSLYIQILSNDEKNFLEACTGVETFASILTKLQLDPSCIFAISKFLIWWPVPVKKFTNHFDECDTLIISSTMEMPWTGMGGRILNEATLLKTHIITCFDSSLNGGEAISSIDALHVIQRLSQTSHEQWDLSWQCFSHKQSSSILEKLLRHAILRYKPKTIYAPAGLAKGTSSSTLRETILKLLSSGHITGVVHLYDDLPASAGYSYVDELFIDFENTYLTPREYYLDASKALIGKMMILDLFSGKLSAGQYRNWIYSGIVNSQEINESAMRFAERFWSIDFNIHI